MLPTNHDNQIFTEAQFEIWRENIDIFSINDIPPRLDINAKHNSCDDIAYNMPLIKILVSKITCAFATFDFIDKHFDSWYIMSHIITRIAFCHNVMHLYYLSS